MKNYVEYKVKARVPFLCAIFRGAEIPVRRMRQTGETCRFCVPASLKEKTERELTMRNKTFEIVRDRSIGAFARAQTARFGLLLGITIAALFLALWSNTVTEVRVSGNRRVAEETILAAIGGEDAFPAWKKDVDRTELEKKLVAVDGVANAALTIKGTVLYVEVLEELDPPEVVDYSERKDVVSSFDGIVTKVVCYAGTPKVKSGDTVRKGDVLIACDKFFPDGSVREERALGDVYGRVWVSEERIYTQTTIVRERTGKRVAFVSGAAYRGNIDAPFQTYDVEEISLRGDSFFPFAQKLTTFYEVTEKEVPFAYEEKKEELIREGTARLGATLPPDSEKVRTWYIEKTVDKNVLLVIYYEIIVKMSED